MTRFLVCRDRPLRATQHPAPWVGRRGAGGRRTVECAVCRRVEGAEERLVAHRLTHGVGVVEQAVGLVDRRERSGGVQDADLTHVAVEERLLQRRRPQQVEGQRQDALALQLRVVLGDHRLELALGAGGGLPGEQRVEHGHEVRLTRAERAREKGSAADSGSDRLADEPQGGVEGLGQGGGDDVAGHRGRHRIVADRVGQAQHVVLGAGALGDRDDVLEEGGHACLRWFSTMRSEHAAGRDDTGCLARHSRRALGSQARVVEVADIELESVLAECGPVSVARQHGKARLEAVREAGHVGERERTGRNNTGAALGSLAGRVELPEVGGVGCTAGVLPDSG